jgi:hypothetical protein
MKTCNNTITLISILFFYLYSIITATIVYIQFTSFDILIVSFTFMGIVFFISLLTYRLDFFKQLSLNYKNFLIAILIFLILFLFSNSDNPHFENYVRTFPLIETELSLLWSCDTAFHVSLIQSILNFGYPSIAHHGHPITFYHVFSHYTDAFILWITGLEPYDSYGLLFHFKIFIFLSSILIFINRVIPKCNLWLYLISIAILFAPIVGSWHAIGSHGLWMGSVILLICSPYLFTKLFDSAHIDGKNAIAIFTIIIVISLSKISSGFMLASFVGFFLLIKSPKQYSTYLIGLGLLIFFYFYTKSFGVEVSDKSAFDFSKISLLNYYNYFFVNELFSSGFLVKKITTTIILLLSIMLFILYLIQNRVTSSVFISSFLTSIILFVITTAKQEFSLSDVWYFQYGLSSSLLLLTFILIIKFREELIYKIGSLSLMLTYILVFKNIRKVHELIDNFKYDKQIYIFIVVSIVIFLAFLSKIFILPCINLFSINYQSIYKTLNTYNTKKFSYVNQKLPIDNQLSIKELLSPKNGEMKNNSLNHLNSNRPLNEMRNKINGIIKYNGIAKNKTALFIPKQIYENDLKQFGGIGWDRGLLIYAITGVQLAHGVNTIPRGYGFGTYKDNRNAFQINVDEFSINAVCSELKISNLIKIETLTPLKLIPVSCPK